MVGRLAIGLTLVVKPVLGPLLLLPLLNRQWRALVPAVVVPVAFNLAALPLISDPMDFFTRTVPYILAPATISTARSRATACTTDCPPG